MCVNDAMAACPAAWGGYVVDLPKLLRGRNGVIPKPRAISSGARDLARSGDSLGLVLFRPAFRQIGLLVGRDASDRYSDPVRFGEGLGLQVESFKLDCVLAGLV